MDQVSPPYSFACSYPSLLGIPVEIRLSIYRYIFDCLTISISSIVDHEYRQKNNISLHSDSKSQAKVFKVPLLLVCKLITSELTPKLYSNIRFNLRNFRLVTKGVAEIALRTYLGLPLGTTLRYLSFWEENMNSFHEEVNDGAFPDLREIVIWGQEQFIGLDHQTIGSNEELLITHHRRGFMRQQDDSIPTPSPGFKFDFAKIKEAATRMPLVRNIYVQYPKGEADIWILRLMIAPGGTVKYIESVVPNQDAIISPEHM